MSKNGFIFQYSQYTFTALSYPSSATITSLLPFRSIRNLNGNPVKNASYVENLGYFRNLRLWRLSETSVDVIILVWTILNPEKESRTGVMSNVGQCSNILFRNMVNDASSCKNDSFDLWTGGHCNGVIFLLMNWITFIQTSKCKWG